MLGQLKQVGMTYFTWRWIWLVMPLALFLMLGAAWNFTSPQHGDKAQFITNFFSGIFGIGMPIMICMQWFISVSKWQFADPRARLIPGYTRPHLVVIFAVLAMFLIVNPLFQAFWMDISPLGPLAFALLVGGPLLYSIHYNQGTLAIPVLAVFFSGMHPETSHFWFSATGNFQAIHVAGILLGAAMLVWWLWKLVSLHEEDEGYFVTPLGALGGLSRLERVLHGRLQGRRAARRGLGRNSSDRWHNRLFTISEIPGSAMLSQYGWGRFSHRHQAISAGFGIAIYGLTLGYLVQWQGKAGSFYPLTYAAAFALPALGAAILLRSRRVRMASELLRPASRKSYFDSLFQSLAKLMLYSWLAMSTGLWVVSMANSQIFEDDFTQLAVGYLLLSLAVQLPALALGLRIAQWRSTVLFALGCYGLAMAELGLLALWFHLQKEASPILVAAFAAVLLSAVGVPLLIGTRNAWLREELG